MLAPYAVHVEHSRGRRFPEPQHPYRNDFQRDRDRVIHARAFRRLEAKTQVFTRRYSDHFRNRLTHTLEVSQVSRTIAGALGLNVDFAEALALVHDIGHPPFGHAGEKALDAAMHEHGLFFDHNLHALRIVEDFEQRYAAFRGLNLTFEVREGIIKHSHDYSAKDHAELAEYLLDQRPPLEAQLIDLTDEIAYNTADLDDGYEAHLLGLEQIREGIPAFERFYREVNELYPEAPAKLKFNETLKRILNRFVDDLITNTRTRIHQAGIQTLDDVRNHAERLAAFSPAVEAERKQSKNFLYENLYFSSALATEKDDAERVIGELFTFWMDNPTTLPHNYQEKAKQDSLPRVICDYIAGMTDNFIFEQYEKHYGGLR
ncbi:MAG TPA: deoxyguanosinetriphosphate triphosphohydrolase [Candidatus Sulfotelmatobacter sp.]|nr:deoxyguanosinetriphosphate triphosphohydrolase [Candidatus Sulfotelmatobacter sp.]